MPKMYVVIDQDNGEVFETVYATEDAAKNAIYDRYGYVISNRFSRPAFCDYTRTEILDMTHMEIREVSPQVEGYAIAWGDVIGKGTMDDELYPTVQAARKAVEDWMDEEDFVAAVCPVLAPVAVCNKEAYTAYNNVWTN